MRFVVIGAGAIGGVVGARLVESGFDVVFVARGAHGRAIARDGLVVASPDRSAAIAVDVVADFQAISFRADDVALVAVKRQDTVAALDGLVTAAPSDVPVVCLQTASTTSERRCADSGASTEPP